MRTIGNMVALKLQEEQDENKLILISDSNKLRRKATVIAAGSRTFIKKGESVIFNTDAADYYDYTDQTYFIRDFKITAVIR